ncbi:hypothetical protein BUALT_Bualt05G0103600 [Buddleja alternifolia]|uniref:DUF7734 domain-containing protein n=1 Tax=Buddleja alternifolia TaxID=168488 RepID=A0AAV6XJL3_9LAMI|nr:hypothetical protein BUALT_Bualt05G0103600 [Buddleja alternifolia]
MDSIIFLTSSLPIFLRPTINPHKCSHAQQFSILMHSKLCQSATNFCYSDSSLPYFFPTRKQVQCGARRRAIFDDEDDGGNYGYNEEIALLETYTEAKKDEILLVHALVDDDEHVEVLIFKGFSSCLTYKTSSDPSRSVLPAKAVIKSIDRVKGPFDPTNIQYIQKGLTFDAFRN